MVNVKKYLPVSFYCTKKGNENRFMEEKMTCTSSKNGLKVGILFSGGPAPAANSVYFGSRHNAFKRRLYRNRLLRRIQQPSELRQSRPRKMYD